jgi:hypothetical protein
MGFEISQREIYQMQLVQRAQDGLQQQKRVRVLIAHNPDWIEVAAIQEPTNNPMIVDITEDDDDKALITVLQADIKAVKVA